MITSLIFLLLVISIHFSSCAFYYGSAFKYRANTNLTWHLAETFKSDYRDDSFGGSVALSEEFALVGDYEQGIPFLLFSF